jgi:phosphoglycolate phosphatase
MNSRKHIKGHRIDLITFDWDGTLMDSTYAIVVALQKAALDIGVAVPSNERASHVIGLGLHEALRFAIPDLPQERYSELSDRYRHHYLSHDLELRLFAGVKELIHELVSTGYKLAVATGKSRKGLDRSFEASGLGKCFLASRCADECNSKPHPQMLEELMDELDVEPQATLMIGDTTHDLQMAINAGVDAVGMTHGAHPEEQLRALHPVALLDDFAALREWLRAA